MLRGIGRSQQDSQISRKGLMLSWVSDLWEINVGNETYDRALRSGLQEAEQILAGGLPPGVSSKSWQELMQGVADAQAIVGSQTGVSVEGGEVSGRGGSYLGILILTVGLGVAGFLGYKFLRKRKRRSR